LRQGNSLRVLVVVTKFPSISETFILDHITALLDSGCYVEILSRWKEKFPKTQPVVNHYRLIERTTYLSDIQKQIPESKLLRVAGAAKIIGRKGIKNIYDLAKSLNIFSLGREAISLKPLMLCGFFLDKPRFDVIHCHYGTNGLLAESLMKIGAIKGKLVTSFHGYDLTLFVRQNGPGVYQTLFSQGNMFLPVNNRFKDELIRLGCEEDKIRVHRMGIDPQKFGYIVRRPKADGALRVLSVGRMVEKKGFKFAVEAFGRIVDQYPDATYDIVGDGPERNQLQKAVADFNLAGRIRLLGWKTRKEVIDLMKAADIFLAPSVTAGDGDSEGIPVVLMEAMAMGLPVISTMHGGIAELVENRRSGFLVPERDVHALAATIDEVIRHPDEIVGITREARRRIEEEFDCRQQNRRLLDIYKELIFV